ncbi:hypothetical protein N1851_027074 [Merluccius polli]|uniref:Reverse transcriptase domain-containing protein n=1 Tax=Merluccius polli TaxID=89951 RepID=A0AA47NSH4_MERPO|nr:hypothetical protein N1851_027074 [Merluccius polli]
MGPDEICGEVLKTCAEQLCNIFYIIFMDSLELQNIPAICKHSTIVPVAKCINPKTLKYFQPVALTSLVMKVSEELIKKDVQQLVVPGSLGPLQFAYRAGRGGENATLLLLNCLHRLLEGPLTHARLFIVFSSTFNTLQPRRTVVLNRWGAPPWGDVDTLPGGRGLKKEDKYASGFRPDCPVFQSPVRRPAQHQAGHVLVLLFESAIVTHRAPPPPPTRRS